MADNSRIEWCDATWNFLVGCTKVSDGCTNCYAVTSVNRMAGHPTHGERYRGLVRMTTSGLQWTGKVAFIRELLERPLQWRRPRRIFVNSQSDLFHPDVPDAWIDEAFAIMALTPRHTYQILTKRPARMAAYMTNLYAETAYETRSGAFNRTIDEQAGGLSGQDFRERYGANYVEAEPGNPAYWDHDVPTPLPNVWLGTSVENQGAADERIPWLLDAPAAVRFLSCEPLLGPVDLVKLHTLDRRPGTSFVGEEVYPLDGLRAVPDCDWESTRIDWVIAGGESGPKARPMHPDWARKLRDDCVAAGVPFLFKQWGNWLPAEATWDDDVDYAFGRGSVLRAHHQDGTVDNHQGRRDHWWRGASALGVGGSVGEPGLLATFVDKHVAGRLLDGRTWDEYPETIGVTS